MKNPAIVHAALRTGTGTQTFTTPDWTDTVQAALVFVTLATAADTVTDGRMLSVGMTDGVTQGVYLQIDDHNLATTFARENAKSDRLIYLRDSGNTDRISAAFSSFGAGSLTINVTANTDDAYLATVILIAGCDDVQADIGASSATNGGTVAVSGLSAPVDVVLVASRRADSWDGPVNNTADNILSLGMATREGTIQQCAHHAESQHNVAATFLGARYDTDVVILHTNASGAERETASITAFDEVGPDYGWTLTTHGTDGAASFMALSLCLGGNSFKLLKNQQTPTTTGSHAITGAGFEPGFFLRLNTAIQTANSAITDNQADALGVSFGNASDQYAVAVDSDDDADPTDTSSYVGGDSAYARSNAAVLYQAAFTSLDSDGVTENWTAVPATAVFIPTLYIEHLSSGLSVAVDPSAVAYVAAGSTPGLGALSVSVSPSSVVSTSPGAAPVLGGLSVASSPSSVDYVAAGASPVLGDLSASVTASSVAYVVSTVDPSTGGALVAVNPSSVVYASPGVSPALAPLSVALSPSAVAWASAGAAPVLGQLGVPVAPSAVSWSSPGASPLLGALEILVGASGVVYAGTGVLPLLAPLSVSVAPSSVVYVSPGVAVSAGGHGFLFPGSSSRSGLSRGSVASSSLASGSSAGPSLATGAAGRSSLARGSSAGSSLVKP